MGCSNPPNELVMWDLSKGVYKKLEGHNQTISDVKFTCDGKYLLSGAYDYYVRVWDVEKNELKKSLIKREEKVTAIAVHSSEPHIAANLSNNRCLFLWDLKKIKCVASMRRLNKNVVDWKNEGTCITFGGNRLLSGTNAGESDPSCLHVWDLEKHTLEMEIKDRGEDIEHLSWHEKTGEVFVAYCDGCCLSKDLRSTQTTATFKLNKKQDISSCSLSQSGNFLSIGGSKGHLVVFDVRFPKNPLLSEIHPIHELSEYRDGTFAKWMSRDFLVSGGGDYLLKIWDIQSGDALIKTLYDHKAEISCITVSRDDSFASGDESGAVILHSLDNSKKLTDQQKI